MRTLKLSPKNYLKIIKESARMIKEGSVIVCPTDTVYGLVCDVTNKKAVEKLFKIKKRPKRKKIPVFVKDIKMAGQLAQISKNQEQFLRQAWPGKVTAVLNIKNQKTKSKSATQRLKACGIDKKTIALRIPNYKVVGRLLSVIGRPLTGTSANISGQAASAKIKDIIRQFKSRKYQPDLVVDAGDLPPAKPSKIVDLTIWPPKILRY